MTRLLINQNLSHGFTTSDFLKSSGMHYFEASASIFSSTERIFVIENEEFHFSATISPEGFTLRRSNYQVSIPLGDIDLNKSEFVKIAFLWDVENIGIAVNGPVRTVETDPILVPNELIKEARKRLLRPVKGIANKEELALRVNEGLEAIQEKLGSTSIHNTVRDSQYEGRKIMERRPKREVDIHPIIYGLLSDQMLMSDIEVISEYRTGVGNVDFAFIAATRQDGLVKHFMEVKNSHSAALVHGLVSQLPDYMANQNVEYGTYCILSYEGDCFGVKNPIFNGLYEARKESRRPEVNNIRLACLNLSKQKPASRV